MIDVGCRPRRSRVSKSPFNVNRTLLMIERDTLNRIENRFYLYATAVESKPLRLR